ncbi:hypothetical protein Tco_0034341 [Tanacetum coccineum]
MLQSHPVRRALSSRLKLRHLRKVQVQRKDVDTSFEIGPHAPRRGSVKSINIAAALSDTKWHDCELKSRKRNTKQSPHKTIDEKHAGGMPTNPF